MAGFIAKRWCRLLSVISLIVISLLVVASQLKTGANKSLDAGNPVGNEKPNEKAAGLHLSNVEQPVVGGGLDSTSLQLNLQDRRQTDHAELPARSSHQRPGEGGKVISKLGKTDPPGPQLPSGALFVVILILSETPDAPHRRALRSSWAKPLQSYHINHDALVHSANAGGAAFTLDNLCRHFFVVGRLARILDYVRTEMETERDIVMVNENDYSSTTVKLYSALSWAKNNLEFEYVVKCKDNVFMNIPGVLQWLTGQAREKLYAGHVMHLARIMKKKRSPWYMDDKFYPGKFYPDYLLTFAMMLSHDIVDRLLITWKPTLSSETGLLHIDDIDLGIAMTKMAVSPLHCPNFFKTFTLGVCHNSQLLVVGEVPREKLQLLGESSLRGSPSC